MFAVDICLCCVWLLHLFPTVQVYENLALHRQAWQNTTYWSNIAERAVDGLKSNLDRHGRQCALSWDHQTTAEWQVDLGAVRSVHHVSIQYVTGNDEWDEDNWYTGTFLGFSVYVSYTPNKEDGVLCFRDTSYTRATIPNPVSISCPYHGRYVIYYNNRTHPPYPAGYYEYAVTYLCEVEVYGCPTTGYYGENCSLPCLKNCACHILEGTCMGCLPGYKGPRCSKECDDNTYGLECMGSCGNCSNGEQCHHVDGSCPSGCDAGVHGKACNEVSTRSEA
uniref:Uncharacterized protein LOC111115163 isoform X2 n=1 Tax=Crassostrea virginica TaxID=6565 RepID=A0A8B8C1I2_CRAVI|nr:uncharacterized protein LOC111115163 isoform X2 [Crassostrea virginica]